MINFNKFLKASLLVINLLYFNCYIVKADVGIGGSIVYDDCIKPWEFGQTIKKTLVLRPIGDICNDRCENECNSFSRKKGSYYDESNSLQSGGIEYNQDIISHCIVTCRSGDLFSSAYRVPLNVAGDNGLDFTWDEPVTTKVACTRGSSNISSVGYNYYDTEMAIETNEQFKVTFMSGNGQIENALYMCGNETVKIDPSFRAYQPSAWNSNKPQWEKRDSSMGNWSARNYNFTDTGIDIKDGDYLAITYDGQYNFDCNDKGCKDNPQGYDLLIRNPQGTSDWGGPSSGSSASLKLPGQSLAIYTVSDPENIDGQAYRQTYEQNAGVKFFGLSGQISSIPNTVIIPDSVDSKQPSYFNGAMNIYRLVRNTTFSGILNGFSDRFTRLGIAHYDTGGEGAWNDNMGGYQVLISRKGCIYSRGERMQYGIGLPDPKSDSSNPQYLIPTEWIDLNPDDLIQNNSFTSTLSGKIYLRIKPLDLENDKLPSCNINDQICLSSTSRVPTLYTLPNAFGQYYVMVEKLRKAGSQTSIITDIINDIRVYLFGSNNTAGTVQKLFNRLVTDNFFANAIRAVMILYIIVTGLSFALGIAQINQKEAVTRILKISIVTILITSKNSWEFFNTYVFRLFTDGGLELIILTSDPTYTMEDLNVFRQDPASIFFAKFDKPLGMMFSKETMLKVVAVMFSGVMGFFLALTILLACVLYAITLARATLIYLVSLIGIAILLLLAPIFISFILFQFTKQMFDAWWKQLASFTFQPVFIFTGIAILNYLLLTGLEVVLGFTACYGCFFSVAIPFSTPYCLVPGIFALWNLHAPDAAIGVPLASVAAVFYFLIIAQASYAFCSFGSKLGNTLITGSFVGVNLAETASRANVFDMAASSTGYALGADNEAQHEAARVSRGYSDFKRDLSGSPARLRNLGSNIKYAAQKATGITPKPKPPIPKPPGQGN